jgi:hypothetical protein
MLPIGGGKVVVFGTVLLEERVLCEVSSITTSS